MPQHRDRPAPVNALPIGAPPPTDERELEELLSTPTTGVIDALRRAPGDVVILGAAGKMGPTLARMVRRALDEQRTHDRVIAVSRFSREKAELRLRAAGVETIRCDLLDRSAVHALPDAPNVLFLAGQKFGTRDAPGTTWALNTLVPAHAAERYADARIVALSTGNVYPFVPITSAGAREEHPVGPVGEYAMSCLGRERIFEWASSRAGTRVALVRLNYAIDLRYGVLTDIALAIWRGEPVSVRMGAVNVIWQGDANARVVQCLPLAATPPLVLNVTGGETLGVRALAERFGQLLGRAPVIVGEEASDALLSDASRSTERFGAPSVSVGQMMVWVADWVRRGAPLLDKPTHFGERAGSF